MLRNFNTKPLLVWLNFPATDYNQLKAAGRYDSLRAMLRAMKITSQGTWFTPVETAKSN